ncbi:MAG: pseudouridine synthase [Cyanobacteria bacterium P01_G01_bin.54]
MPERVQKILAQWGIASRRKAEQMILDGRVRCNGRVVTLGDKAIPEQDRLEVDGQLLHEQNRPEPLTILLNKPLGVLSTCHDPQQRPTVLDCLPQHWQRGYGLHPVGRLDADSTGAILLTNDGSLTLALTHPRYHLPKTYRVWVAGVPKHSTLDRWREGVLLDGIKTRRAQLRVLKTDKRKVLIEVVLREGRNRQIRRVAEQLGHPVIALHRSAIGNLKLKPNAQASELSLGASLLLSSTTLERLFKVSHILGDLNLPKTVSENSVCAVHMIS